MKQKIVRNQNEGICFAEGGRRRDQREAFWMRDGNVVCAQRAPGQKHCRIIEGTNPWWSKTMTVKDKMRKDSRRRAAARAR